MNHSSLRLPEGLHIRPSRSSDRVFLEQLYRSTREDLEWIDADRDVIDTIMSMQYKAQTQGYGEQFPNALYFIIEYQDERIGRAALDFGTDEIRVVDIAFLPKARGRGYGESVIRAFMVCAEQSMAPLTLSVLQHNLKARALYERLGFKLESVSLPYLRLVWYPRMEATRVAAQSG